MLVIDTSVLIPVERGGRGLEVPGGAVVAVAAVTVAELLHGAERADSADRRQRREAFVEALLADVPVVAFDLVVARRYAALWAEVARRGTPVGAHDLMIGATAAALGFAVWTRNARDFRAIPGLDVLVDA